MRVRQVIKKETNVPRLGQKIKKIREGLKISGETLAKEVGISRYYLYQVEFERVDAIALDKLQRIEKVLNTKLVDEECLIVCD